MTRHIIWTRQTYSLTSTSLWTIYHSFVSHSSNRPRHFHYFFCHLTVKTTNSILYRINLYNCIILTHYFKFNSLCNIIRILFCSHKCNFLSLRISVVVFFSLTLYLELPPLPFLPTFSFKWYGFQFIEYLHRMWWLRVPLWREAHLDHVHRTPIFPASVGQVARKKHHYID